MATILVADKITPEGLELLAAGGKHTVINEPAIEPDELLRRIPEADAVVVRSRARITGEMIEAAPKLRVVGRAGVGLDNVDVATATRCGVIVMNAPEGNTISTAEHTIAMLMSMARNIPAADATMKAGGWDKSKYKGVEIRGKTIGVIGYGRIGREVSTRMLAFKANVMAYDPFVTAEAMKSHGVTQATVDEIVEQADFITVHVPMTDQTRGLIDAAAIKKMKPTARLINVARGGIIDEQALADGLNNGEIAGAAIDVFEKEPAAADHPLRSAKNCILTPHLGASTGEAQSLVVSDLARQILDVLDGGTVRNAANFPRLSAEVLDAVQPYLELSERLGGFLSQLVEGSIKSMSVGFYGRAAVIPDVSPISTAAAYGYLRPISSNRLNYVNARHQLSEHGVKVAETKHPDSDSEFTTLVELRAIGCDDEEYLVAGTLFGAKDQPKLVRVNEVWLDASPRGEMIVLENADVPGVIGKVATILGNHQYNIGSVAWGRTEAGADALTVINLDDEVTTAVLDELRSLDEARQVRRIVLSA